MGTSGGRASPGARVGVRQVAERAGVSTQTVSRVLNGHPNIRDETRRRVLDAMSALEYRVNNAARALGTRSSRTLGIIVADAVLHGPTAAIAALEHAAREVGRWVVTAYTAAGDERSLREAVDHLLGQGVDAIALVALDARAAHAATARAGGVRVVSFEDDAGLTVQRAAAALAVEHLVSLGHRRIARLAGPADWAEEQARADGVATALTAHGLPLGGEWRGDWSAGAGAAVAPEVAAAVMADRGPTAVVVANDQMALGLVAGLAAQGVDVPAHVSVTGFDDNPDAAFYRPALTTVAVDLAAQARRCVAAALELPDAAATASTAAVNPDTASTVAPALVVRASTAAPRG